LSILIVLPPATSESSGTTLGRLCIGELRDNDRHNHELADTVALLDVVTVAPDIRDDSVDLSAIAGINGWKLAYDTASAQAAARKYVPHIAVRQFQTEAERQLIYLPGVDGLVSGAEHVRAGIVVMRSYRSGAVEVN
jgi:hypothetical protein